HIIGLLNGQSVKVKEDAVVGYGVITDDKLHYNETDGYYTELQYDNKSDYQRTFRNYPISISLMKQVTNPEGNEEVIQNSVFTFQLCKQETIAGDTVYTPLTEAETSQMRGYILESQTATTFQPVEFSGAVGNEFTLKDSQKLVIIGAEPDTTYVIKEIGCEIDGVRSDNSYSKGNNGITILESAGITSTSSNTYLTGSFNGIQQNTYSPQAGLSISKQIENDYNGLTDPNADYQFQIQKKNASGTYENQNNLTYKLNGTESKTTDENGCFTLKVNEYAFFPIQKGEYHIIEINPNKNLSDKLFTTTCIVDGGAVQTVYDKTTEKTTNTPVDIKITGTEEQSAAFTNRVIDKEYQFNIEKIIYRDKNAHGDTDDNEQRFVFRIDRYDIDADVNNLPEQSIETFYVTLNCPNQVTYNQSKYYLNSTEFDLPEFRLDENTSFDGTNQKITKTYTDSSEKYTYPATIWQGSVSAVVNRKGVYKVTEVENWSATDYDYCKGSNTFKGVETVTHSDKSVTNTDYVAFKVEENSEKTASFSNAESEFAYFSSSAYAINRMQAAQN
ncbi:MAG: hypothetical protein VZR10_09140, partial [Methanobrevibacter sp.]|nr:hypothetical protein [Methanobrevibacter sp.]